MKERIARILCAWFAKAKRDMPWRREPTPYCCWLSEIMLQQTTFVSALPYYERFLKRFPTVEALAAADESAVLKVWEGLGYYARARNLLKAAQMIVGDASQRRRDRPVAWPTCAAEWSKVPGVGPYTAAALSSVLNGERVPVVDGNVARVFARFWMMDDDFSKLSARERLAERLLEHMPAPRAGTPRGTVQGDFNQAMMELGALVCTPKSPACRDCPLAKTCAAHKARCETDYPKKAKKGTVPVRRQKAVIIRNARGEILLVQNRDGGLLKGLWELPTIDEIGSLTHVFSHFKLEQTNYAAARTDAEFKNPLSVPLTTATRKALAI